MKEELGTREAVLAKLAAFAGYPLSCLRWLSGRPLNAFIAEATALSPATVAKGLDKLRPSTEAKALQAMERWSLEQANRKGWPKQDMEAIQRQLLLWKDSFRPLAFWIHAQQEGVDLSLPLSIRCATEIDELIDALLSSAKADSLDAFTATLERYALATDRMCLTSALNGTLSEAGKDWVSADRVVDKLLIDLLQSLQALLDAEWSGRYAPGMAPHPWFLWVMPRINAAAAPAGGFHLGRNALHQPVRRLLEFSHALACRKYTGRWPDKAGGRSEIGAAVGLDDHVVGNYFEGTKKLTLDGYRSLWHRFCVHFDVGGKGNMPCPQVLAIQAIVMQGMWLKSVRQKVNSIVQPDEEEYRAAWQTHRRRWALELDTARNEPWPVWLTAQSLFSCATSSSQSSGR